MCCETISILLDEKSEVQTSVQKQRHAWLSGTSYIPQAFQFVKPMVNIYIYTHMYNIPQEATLCM